jgi:hypothetical protein
LNICVLVALASFLSPHLGIARLAGAQSSEHFLQKQAEFSIIPGWQGRYTDRLLSNLEGVKVQIHTDQCRRGDFSFLQVEVCDPKNSS